MTEEMEYNIDRMNKCKGWMQETENGIAYDYGLASWKGAWFVLFKEKHHTLEDIKKAKRELKNSRDVVSLDIVKINPK